MASPSVYLESILMFMSHVTYLKSQFLNASSWDKITRSTCSWQMMKIQEDPHFVKLWIKFGCCVWHCSCLYLSEYISSLYQDTQINANTLSMAESWVSITLELDGTLHHDTETLRCWKKWSLGSERNLDDAEEVMGDGTGTCKLRLTCFIDSTVKSFGIQGTASQAIGKLVEGQNNCWCDQHHVFVWFKQQGTNIFNPS